MLRGCGLSLASSMRFVSSPARCQQPWRWSSSTTWLPFAGHALSWASKRPRSTIFCKRWPAGRCQIILQHSHPLMRSCMLKSTSARLCPHVRAAYVFEFLSGLTPTARRAGKLVGKTKVRTSNSNEPPAVPMRHTGMPDCSLIGMRSKTGDTARTNNNNGLQLLCCLPSLASMTFCPLVRLH